MHSQPHPCAHGPYSAFPAFPLRAAPEFEDCLFLNVWAPFEPAESGNGFTRPVVVVLVGGNFVSGGSSDHEFFDGSIMASTWDQVIVVPNYRVGVLGFYTAVTANASHDAGIQDQLLALQWVNRHITKYGGDPNRVTLLGHEAGATAVGFHLLSPDSSELFARAILLSGSPYRPLPARDGSAIGKISRELLCIRNGSHHSDENAARCLKTKSVRALLDRQRAMTLNGAVAAFSPSFGGTSLPEVLSQVAETGRFGDKGRVVARKPKQILVGSTRNEGSAYVMALLSFYGAESERSMDIRTTSHILETYLERHGVIGMGEEILRAYMLRNEAAYRSPVSALERAIGDFAVNCPMKRFLESYAVGKAAGGGDVYVYYFKHVPHFRWWPYWMGAPQMLDWLYVSGNLQKLRRAKINVTDSDALLSITLASLVSCFAWTG
ncbi:hypothetical protein HPB48_012414 [Haemaphysalis longicornis]|uniref:Carboxylesterase type B domain-containing protein n=1 Tax=Haemaphysalis longicornis TaxID=44386 RepID=A0A9J6G1U3_HAELO|nr:hypothetical protein HPB48_012414 [Haemaphysalis longicornis]